MDYNYPGRVRDAVTILDILEARARRTPHRIVYVHHNTGSAHPSSLSYGELRSRSMTVAQQVSARVSLHDRVLILQPFGLEFISSLLGCMYAGAVAVPAALGNARHASRVDAIVADARPRLVLTSQRSAGIASRLLRNSHGLELLATDTLAPPAAATECHGASGIALLQYTSGSTTTPRGVIITHRNLTHNLHAIRRAFGTDETSVIVGWVPMVHDMGLVGNVLQPLYAGAVSVLVDPLSVLAQPDRWLRTIAQYNGTISGAPNFAYDLCVNKVTERQKAHLDLSTWVCAFNGSEPVRADTMRRFARAFASCGFRPSAFFPCYGLAESTLMVSGGPWKGEETDQASDVQISGGLEHWPSSVSCGRIAIGQRVILVDPETNEVCPPRVAGEVLVQGKSVAHGYWGRPKETERTFRRVVHGRQGTFLRTGDIGRVVDEELRIIGRLKDLIIINGVKHHPEDLEAQASASHRLLEGRACAAFATDATRVAILHEIGRGVSAYDEIISAIRNRVASECGVELSVVALVPANTLPRTGSGKIQRYLCRQSFQEGTLHELAREESPVLEPLRESAEQENVAGPSGPGSADGRVESFRQVVAEFVGERAPDLSLSAARLGLSSLRAVELAARIERQLRIVISPTAFLGEATLRDVFDTHAQNWGEPARKGSSRPSQDRSDQLSHEERALWLLEAAAPGSRKAFRIVRALRIVNGGRVDAQLLERAFQALGKKHAALRTTFASGPKGPIRRVHADTLVDFAAECWETDLDTRLSASLEALRALDLPPARGPLFRARLWNAADGQVIALAASHLVADFWSMALLLKELGAAYERLRLTSDESDTQGLPADYEAFVAYEKRLLETDGERLRAYWATALAGCPSQMSLGGRSTRGTQSYRGGTVPFQIENALGRQLVDSARANGVTTYVATLAILQIVLARYARSEDVLVGSPAARRYPGFEHVVGNFINLLLLRGQPRRGMSFREYVRFVQGTVQRGLQHQDYPSSFLDRRVWPERLPGQGLCQVMLTFHNDAVLDQLGMGPLALGAAGGDVRLGPFTCRSVMVLEDTAQMDLCVALAESRDGFIGKLQFDAQKWDKTAACGIVEDLQAVVRGVVMHPDRDIWSIPLARDSSFNVSNAVPPAILSQQFEWRARCDPDARALTYGETHVTYGELNRRANRLARCLRSFGVRPETRVALLLSDLLESVVALIGILKAGGAYVAISPSSPPARVEEVLRDVQPTVLLTDQAMFGNIPSELCARLVIDAERSRIESYSDDDLQCDQVPDNLAYVMYTSGSTGTPKGVMVTHRNVSGLLESVRQIIPFSSEDVWTLFHSLSFDYSVWEVFGALCSGSRIVIVPESARRAPEELYDLLEKERVTVFSQTPSALQEFFRVNGPRLRDARLALRWITLGGEALQPGILRSWFASHGSGDPQFVNMFGITETTVHSTAKLLSASDTSGGSVIGSNLPGVLLCVDGQVASRAPAGTEGEVSVGGWGVARGYWRQPALTAERFLPDRTGAEIGARSYRSGDLASITAGGELLYRGRRDRQVKLRGFRIELAEIEHHLRAHPAVKAAIVTATQAEESGGVSLSAYIVPDTVVAAPLANLLRLEREGKLDDRDLYELPDHNVLVHQRKGVTDGIYKEVFEERVYLTHGIVIPDGGCVFDIGANIGLFSLCASQSAERVQVFAFEPIPETFAILSLNNELFGYGWRVFNCGLGAAPGRHEFWHYPFFPGSSGRYPDNVRDREDLRAFIVNEQRRVCGTRPGHDTERVLDVVLDEWLTERGQSVQRDCEVCTVSGILERTGVTNVDLLKIDCERSEIDVLLGIDESHWSRIQQIVIEVHDAALQERALEVLRGRGYRAEVDQNPYLTGTELRNIYARRPDYVVAFPSSDGARAATPPRFPSQRQLEMELRRHLSSTLADYMVPARIEFLDSFPLTPNGKVDEPRLRQWRVGTKKMSAMDAPAADVIQAQLHDIWSEMLDRSDFGVTEDFFDLGGHSLLMMQVAVRIRESYRVEIPLGALFDAPTISGMTGLIVQRAESM